MPAFLHLFALRPRPPTSEWLPFYPEPDHIIHLKRVTLYLLPFRVILLFKRLLARTPVQLLAQPNIQGLGRSAHNAPSLPPWDSRCFPRCETARLVAPFDFLWQKDKHRLSDYSCVPRATLGAVIRRFDRLGSENRAFISQPVRRWAKEVSYPGSIWRPNCFQKDGDRPCRF